MGRRSSRGFTLVELLVVIGIIAVLIGILMPSLTRARRSAARTVCLSNMRQTYLAMQLYSTESRGWIFPVGPASPSGAAGYYGGNVPPDQRWPVLVRAFNVRLPPAPIQYVSSFGTFLNTDYPAGFGGDVLPMVFDAKPYTPRVLVCPEDDEPVDAHSYVLNMHVADEKIRFGTTRLGAAHSSSNVILMGEKRTRERDYYMNSIGGSDQEFERVVEPYRHGIAQGSNYLFMDGHVDNRLPVLAKAMLDPWDVAVTPVGP